MPSAAMRAWWLVCHHRKPILYVCLIGFLWYHGVERNISKCMGWNQLWPYLGEYWNKLNFTCLICSWSLSWSLKPVEMAWNCYRRSRKTPTTNEPHTNTKYYFPKIWSCPKQCWPPLGSAPEMQAPENSGILIYYSNYYSVKFTHLNHLFCF